MKQSESELVRKVFERRKEFEPEIGSSVIIARERGWNTDSEKCIEETLRGKGAIFVPGNSKTVISFGGYINDEFRSVWYKDSLLIYVNDTDSFGALNICSPSDPIINALQSGEDRSYTKIPFFNPHIAYGASGSCLDVHLKTDRNSKKSGVQSLRLMEEPDNWFRHSDEMEKYEGPEQWVGVVLAGNKAYYIPFKQKVKP
jgi:hypothetical protein